MQASKIALVAGSGIAFGLYEGVFNTFLGGWFSWFHPVLALTVFFVALERRNYALLFCGTAGLVMDAFAINTPTLAVWRLLLAAAAMSVVSEKVLTNRSLYSAAALVVLGRAVDFGGLFAEEKFLALRGIRADLVPAWSEALGIVAWDVVLTVGLFVFGMFILRRYLRPRRLLNRYG
ncbi:MAG: hypothetical protein WC551_02485 [Patescibacteria group bacterium]